MTTCSSTSSRAVSRAATRRVLNDCVMVWATKMANRNRNKNVPRRRRCDVVAVSQNRAKRRSPVFLAGNRFFDRELSSARGGGRYLNCMQIRAARMMACTMAQNESIRRPRSGSEMRIDRKTNGNFPRSDDAIMARPRETVLGLFSWRNLAHPWPTIKKRKDTTAKGRHDRKRNETKTKCRSMQ